MISMKSFISWIIKCLNQSQGRSPEGIEEEKELHADTTYAEDRMHLLRPHHDLPVCLFIGHRTRKRCPLTRSHPFFILSPILFPFSPLFSQAPKLAPPLSVLLCEAV